MSIMDCGCVQPWRILVVCQVKVKEIHFSKFFGLLLAIISKSRLLHRYLSRILNRFVTQLFWRAPPSSSFCLNSFFFFFQKGVHQFMLGNFIIQKNLLHDCPLDFHRDFHLCFDKDIFEKHFWETLYKEVLQKHIRKFMRHLLLFSFVYVKDRTG